MLVDFVRDAVFSIFQGPRAYWLWLALLSALFMNVLAVVILSIHPLRRQRRLLNTACVLAFVAIWIEKGIGFVVPGFIPTPLGEVFEYSPTLVELVLAAGIWAFGALVFTLLARASIAIDLGDVSAGRSRPLADATG